ncbi:hypothetical protein BSPWISOXPB_77 [uncultured Gammaproteobacteria bacterium]|nr:hypothetical protein BSPWISOXPB_77 [uncultured Gammaproteobacteria bacterium]
MDPIGVYSRESLNGWPEWPDDEYTSYIGGLINLIELNATEEDFFDYLWEVETKHIGMPGNRENTTTHAKKIKNLTK